MSQRVTRRYGMPIKRYVSSVPRHMASVDAITGDSQNMMADHADGSYFRRGGTANVGGTSGLLDSGWPSGQVRPRRMLGFNSPSESGGDSTYGALWAMYGSTEYQEFYFRSIDNSTNHVIGDSFGATHYPAHDHYWPMYPGIGNRLKVAADRRAAFQGSANCIEVGERILFPNYGSYGSQPLPPIGWNKRFNDTTSTGTEHERLRHAGPIPPLWAPTWAFPAPSTNGGEQFLIDTYFFISVIFVFGDGSPSMPFIPRQVNATLPTGGAPNEYTQPGGLGFVRVGRHGDGAGSRYQSITLSNIPIGPDGVVKRIILATPTVTDPKTLKIANSDGTSNLQIWATVNDNTTTSIVMQDFQLIQDTNLVRFDHIMMPPAKFAWQGDQRVWACHTGVNPTGIFITPFINNPDSTIGADTYEVTWNSGTTTLTLRNGDGSTTAIAAAAMSIQDLLDNINVQLLAAARKQWAAQAAPGVDVTQAATKIVDWSGSDYGDSAAGRMRCFSNAMPGVIYLTVDTNPTSSRWGKRRVFFTAGGPGQQSLAPDAWRTANYRTAPETAGWALGGGHTYNGQVMVLTKGIAIIRNIKNIKTGEDIDYRIEMMNERRGGISADSICQLDGAVGYMTAEGYVINDGLREILISPDIYNPASGVGEWAFEIQQCQTDIGTDPATTAAGPNGKFCASAYGGKLFIAYRSSNITSCPDSLLVYDFSQGIDASGLPNFTDGGEPWGWSAPLRFAGYNYGVYAGPVVAVPSGGGGVSYYMGGYRNNTTPGRIEQLFTGQFDQNGTVVATVTTNGTNVATSTGGLSAVAIGAVLSGHSKIPGGTTVTSLSLVSGTWNIGLSAVATGSTSESTTFSGVKVVGMAYFLTDMMGTMLRKTAQRCTVLYKNANDPLTLYVSRDKGRASQRSLTLPASTAGQIFTRTVKNLPQVVKTPAEVLEFAVVDSGGTADAPRIWGIEAEVDILDSVR